MTEPEITVSPVVDFAALEVKWRDLEVRSGASFFQSWTWTGCLVEERFPEPVLVEARAGGRTVALALFNRRDRTLHLGQTGDPNFDCIYIEFNGVLAEIGCDTRLTEACLQAARTGPVGRPKSGRIPMHRLVLSGISDTTAVAAAKIGNVRYNRSLAAPSVDLRDQNRCFLDSRSANTRQQIRRSNRDYARTGDILVDRADTLFQAYDYFDGMAALHQTSWLARGFPGAFANPFFGRFHRALIARGLERGEIDLLRVTAGSRAIGLLYNFRHRGHSLAYQSGFDYAGSGPREKPGLTCHYEAILFAERWGAVRYDFLAGDTRYKRSFSDRTEMLHWIEIESRYSPRFFAARLSRFVTGRLPARRHFRPPHNTV
jgi:CelD/BcsL family acetyltransferase involved in cellulose biosynthesis